MLKNTKDTKDYIDRITNYTKNINSKTKIMSFFKIA